ncbi:hypothetical protein A7U60_g1121 [Sanghuangporus baumii]|uniref:DUF6534 domain-containing protein n=1 Tax=Sanghuangporus baumii TaxID=108892 RepID=A0A9Q5N9K8_SANBA|nr:hypothetical protein A7U60_g1121 [Sanghuangporus baumii]
MYCETFWKTDQRWLKAYISSLWILETALQALIADNGYIYLVKGITDPTLWFRYQQTTPTITAFAAVIDAMIQALLIRRAWYLSNKNRILTGALCVAVLAQFAVTMTYSIRIAIVRENKLLPGMQLAAAATAAITDTYLAVVLVWLLRKARSGFKRSDSVVNRLVTYTIGSSLVTAVSALFALVSAVVAPYSSVYLLGDLLLPKLYFNCLLALLNARSSLRAAAEQESGGMSIHLENVSSSTGEPNQTASNSNKASIPKATECRINVRIETGTERPMVLSETFSVVEVSADVEKLEQLS